MARLEGLFRESGKEQKRVLFLSMWIARFGKFIAPKQYHQAGVVEVEAFLRSLAEGRNVEQVDEALRMLYKKMHPVPLAGK